jgi:3-oxoacyl-[acyl-carrier protein] reductase
MARVVLVTGGGSGIGRAVAQRFAADGDRVVITGRHAGPLAQAAAEIGAQAVRCDGAEPDDIALLAGELGDRVDVVVNMAGGNTDLERTTSEDMSLEDVAAAWRANLDANLLSTVLTTTGLLPAVPAGGAIITVSSIGAEYASTSYGAAKAAVAAWTAGLSAQVGPRGVTANTIAPGYIADTGFFHNSLTDERRAGLIEATHDKRAGLPEDIAAIAHFLASDGARHITGQTLHVNGGAHTTR